MRILPFSCSNKHTPTPTRRTPIAHPLHRLHQLFPRAHFPPAPHSYIRCVSIHVSICTAPPSIQPAGMPHHHRATPTRPLPLPMVIHMQSANPFPACYSSSSTICASCIPLTPQRTAIPVLPPRALHEEDEDDEEFVALHGMTIRPVGICAHCYSR